MTALDVGSTELEARLNQYREETPRFNPLKLDYAASLLKRGESKSYNVRERLWDKAEAVLEQYQQDLLNAQNKAREQIDTLVAKQVYLSTELEFLFKQGEFDAIERLFQQQMAANEQTASPLLELIEQLNQLNRDHIGEEQSHTLAQQLRVQEQSALDANQTDSDDFADEQSQSAAELVSMRRFRETLEQHSADRLVNISIQQGPENPGPLNPHQLAIRSLSSMRDISPQYLARFVAMMDTLFWLETTDQKATGPRKKASGGNKRKS